LDSHHYRSSLASRPARQHRRRFNSSAFGYCRGRPYLPLRPRQVPRLESKPCSAAANAEIYRRPSLGARWANLPSSDGHHRTPIMEIPSQASCPVRRCRRKAEGVCTMCTPWASDWAVLRSDRGVPGEPSVGRGWSPVRVPPRARITPRQRGFCFNVSTLTLRGSFFRTEPAGHP